MKKLKCITAITFILLIIGLSICSANSSLANQVREIANPLTENALTAMNENNYDNFSKDFDAQMKIQLNQKEYEKMILHTKTKIGNYLSKDFVSAEINDKFTIVIYKARFSAEPSEVIVRNILSETNGRYYISGLWIDSPKLRTN